MYEFMERNVAVSIYSFFIMIVDLIDKNSDTPNPIGMSIVIIK